MLVTATRGEHSCLLQRSPLLSGALWGVGCWLWSAWGFFLCSSAFLHVIVLMLLPCFVLIPSGEAALGAREVGAWEAACPAGERAHACVCVCVCTHMSYPSTYCAVLGGALC